MQMDKGTYRNSVTRLDSSVVQPCNSADKLLLHEREDSRLKTSLQISVSVLPNSEYFFPIDSLDLQVSLNSETPARIALKQDPMNFQRKLLAVHSVQVDLQKAFPDMPNEFRVPGLQARIETKHSTKTWNTHGLTGNVG